MTAARPMFCLAVLALTGFGVNAASTRPATQADTIAYLGVVTSPVTPALAAQLGLPAGVGVTIEALDADGPAERAGVRVHDVITKIDDQVVVNVQQFGVLVRLHAGGDTARLQLVRRGQTLNLPATLGERPIPPAEPVVRLPLPPHGGRISSVIQHVDGEHSITVTTQIDGRRQVRVVGRTGDVVYDGPLDSPDDTSKVPADCLKKIDTIQRHFEQFQKLRGTSQPTK